jgi:hypothetical protein
MSLFEPESFENFTSSLPGVSLVDQWESRVAKVGGKVLRCQADIAGPA